MLVNKSPNSKALGHPISHHTKNNSKDIKVTTENSPILKRQKTGMKMLSKGLGSKMAFSVATAAIAASIIEQEKV